MQPPPPPPRGFGWMDVGLVRSRFGCPLALLALFYFTSWLRVSSFSVDASEHTLFDPNSIHSCRHELQLQVVAAHGDPLTSPQSTVALHASSVSCEEEHSEHSEHTSRKLCAPGPHGWLPITNVGGLACNSHEPVGESVHAVTLCRVRASFVTTPPESEGD